jgi:hypothetical protein
MLEAKNVPTKMAAACNVTIIRLMLIHSLRLSGCTPDFGYLRTGPFEELSALSEKTEMRGETGITIGLQSVRSSGQVATME